MLRWFFLSIQGLPQRLSGWDPCLLSLQKEPPVCDLSWKSEILKGLGAAISPGVGSEGVTNYHSIKLRVGLKWPGANSYANCFPFQLSHTSFVLFIVQEEQSFLYERIRSRIFGCIKCVWRHNWLIRYHQEISLRYRVRKWRTSRTWVHNSTKTRW